MLLKLLTVGALLATATKGQCPSSVCHDLENGVPSGFQKVSYTESHELLQNPRRGFWDEMTTKTSAFHPLSMGDLNWRRNTKGAVVINRIYTMDTFRTSDLSGDFLHKVRADLQMIRDGKMTTVMRFCYIFRNTGHIPYEDANKVTVLKHIKQLSPIFHEFVDVIDAIQAGFIGAWGEWAYTTYFGAPEHRDYHKYPHTHGYSPENIQDRKDVLGALLDAAPNEIFAMQRYPHWNRYIFGDSPPTLKDVQSHTHKGRTGFHNDCFLSNSHDTGTYSGNIQEEYDYVHEQTKYLPAGGETCSTSNTDPNRHRCPTALHEMGLFHWSYLNIEYHKGTLEDWKKQGCFNDIFRKMGYRFVLKEAVLPSNVNHGSDFCVRIVIRNEGFAAPIRNYDVFLVLKKGSSTYASQLAGHDLRLWLPGKDLVMQHSIHVPTSVPSTETYDVYLVFRDKYIPTESDYNILLANNHVPDHHSGMNNLGHKIVVHGGTVKSSHCPFMNKWTPPKASTHHRTVSDVHL